MYSLNPCLGRKGKGGYLKKCSGGHTVKLSNSEGMLKIWTLRWIEAHDNCIVYYEDDSQNRAYYYDNYITTNRNNSSGNNNTTGNNNKIEGILRVDSGLSISCVGRYIIIKTNSRTLTLYAQSRTHAIEWKDSLTQFYSNHIRLNSQPFQSSFPPRENVDEVQIFTTSRDYFFHVSRALLMAKEEILISAWKLSPNVLLTRSPLPPLRLDQILKYKADQGIKIYILLYQEVELAGQGNDSQKAKNHLINLSPNIQVIRHPNKLFGHTKAVLWSHHEKLVIIDRTVSFIGGLDLSLNRYDDYEHHLEDESGIRFPGSDYRQNAPGLLKSVRPIPQDQPSPSVFFELPTNLEARFSSFTSLERSSFFSTSPPPTIPEQRKSLNNQNIKNDLNFNNINNHDINLNNNQRNSINNNNDNNNEFDNDNDDNSIEDEQFPEPETNEEAVIREMAEMDVENGVNKLMSENSDSDSSQDDDDDDDDNDNSPSSGTFLEGLKGFSSKFECQNKISKPTRLLYPRIGWHDVHAKIIGIPARDIASHFVQRWNFHRASKNKTDKEVLLDVTDNPFFGQCAACNKNNILETYSHCPNCGYSLGTPSSYFIKRPPLLKYNQSISYTSLRLPELPNIYCFIDFEINIYPPTGLILYGDGPVTIENILDIPTNIKSGILKYSQGEQDKCQTLIERGLIPSIGDIFAFIEGNGIGHLSTNEVQQYIEDIGSKKQNKLSIILRRYYITGLVDIYEPLKNPNIPPATSSNDLTDISNESSPYTITSLKVDPNNIKNTNNNINYNQIDSSHLMVNRIIEEIPSINEKPEKYQSMRYLPLNTNIKENIEIESQNKNQFETDIKTEIQTNSQIEQNINHQDNTILELNLPDTPQHDIILLPTAPTHLVDERNIQITRGLIDLTDHYQEIETSSVDLASGPKKLKPPKLGRLISGEILQPSPLYLSENIFPNVNRRKYINEAISMELMVRRGIIVHVNHEIPESYQQIAAKSFNSCKVQVLRSSGKWSVGEEVEKSIQNAYIEGIQNSKHLIYIENQFFIGSPEPIDAEGHPQNRIISALAKRIIKAIQQKEHFRVIVILPQHPSGDFLNHESPRIIYHYEFMSICRGGRSLYEYISQQCPNANIFDYLSFHCLRNYAEMNMKIVSEQIYVHDKIIIIDDCIAIIGSANINDRSMNGDRDSEMAIRIEDTLQIIIQLGGKDWKAGNIIHQMRMNLMRQHIGEKNPLSEKLCDISYHSLISSQSDPFTKYWKKISDDNSKFYDWLDGENVSIYSCTKLQQLKDGLKNYVHPIRNTLNDEQISQKLKSVQGFLINWPLNFLMNENLLPSMAYLPFVNTNLWL